MASVRSAFEAAYVAMLDSVLARGLPTALCTIYEPRLDEADLRRAAVTALLAFNDVIAHHAYRNGLPLIDLRTLCNEASDFANPIEPSEKGGDKIAAAIARVLAEHDFSRRRTEVFIR